MFYCIALKLVHVIRKFHSLGFERMRTQNVLANDSKNQVRDSTELQNKHSFQFIFAAKLLLAFKDLRNIPGFIFTFLELSCVHSTSLQMRADYCKVCFYGRSDAWRTVMPSKSKIFDWFFACSILLGKATDYFFLPLCHILKNKNHIYGPNVLYFASMIQ